MENSAMKLNAELRGKLYNDDFVAQIPLASL